MRLLTFGQNMISETLDCVSKRTWTC